MAMENIQILAENIIKIEEMKKEAVDQTEESSLNSIFKEEAVHLTENCSLNCIVKQELGDCAEEQASILTVGNGPCTLKMEVQDHKDNENDDEEELKPPLRVFLDPKEEADVEVEQEKEDPLATCNDMFGGGSSSSVGGEFGPESIFCNSGSPKRSTDETYYNDSNKETDLTVMHSAVYPNKSVGASKHSVLSDLHFRKAERARRKDEHFVCGNNLSESEYEVRVMRRRDKCYECSQCQKSYKSKSSLVTHVRIHSGERPYECSICKKRFMYRTSYVEHLRIHSGERPYECSVCRKSFTCRSHLRRHVSIHRRQRIHECSVCQESFVDRSSLVSHIRIHRPHKCSVCQKRFRQRGILKRHMLIHGNESPHECSVCQKRFSQRGHLKRHMLIHGNKRPLVCSVCQRNFTYKLSLEYHMLIHSSERPH